MELPLDDDPSYGHCHLTVPPDDVFSDCLEVELPPADDFSDCLDVPTALHDDTPLCAPCSVQLPGQCCNKDCKALIGLSLIHI